MAVNRDLSELVEVAASSQQDCDLPADGRLEVGLQSALLLR